MQHDALDASYEGFKDELVEAGVKEENIDYIVAGDQANCSTVADKLVNGENDLIYAIATPALQSVAAATTDIPIVGLSLIHILLRPAGIASTKDSFHALWIRTIKYFCVTTHRS